MTAWTIRLALLCYVVALVAELSRASSHRRAQLSRAAWTAGCVLAWAHLAAAFHVHHHWSHAHAAAETSRRTVEVVGWSWGGEIFFNYAFVAVWTGDVLWRWLAPESYRRRRALMSVAIHGFLVFIIFNATIVFEGGPIRIAAIFACALLAAMVFRRTMR